MKKGIIFNTVFLLVISAIALVLIVLFISNTVKPGEETLRCQKEFRQGCLKFMTDGGCKVGAHIMPVIDGYINESIAYCAIDTNDDDIIKEECCKMNR